MNLTAAETYRGSGTHHADRSPEYNPRPSDARPAHRNNNHEHLSREEAELLTLSGIRATHSTPSQPGLGQAATQTKSAKDLLHIEQLRQAERQAEEDRHRRQLQMDLDAAIEKAQETHVRICKLAQTLAVACQNDEDQLQALQDLADGLNDPELDPEEHERLKRKLERDKVLRDHNVASYDSKMSQYSLLKERYLQHLNQVRSLEAQLSTGIPATLEYDVPRLPDSLPEFTAPRSQAPVLKPAHVASQQARPVHHLSEPIWPAPHAVERKSPPTPVQPDAPVPEKKHTVVASAADILKEIEEDPQIIEMRQSLRKARIELEAELERKQHDDQAPAATPRTASAFRQPELSKSLLSNARPAYAPPLLFQSHRGPSGSALDSSVFRDVPAYSNAASTKLHRTDLSVSRTPLQLTAPRVAAPYVASSPAIQREPDAQRFRPLTKATSTSPTLPAAVQHSHDTDSDSVESVSSFAEVPTAASQRSRGVSPHRATAGKSKPAHHTHRRTPSPRLRRSPMLHSTPMTSQRQSARHTASAAKSGPVRITRSVKPVRDVVNNSMHLSNTSLEEIGKAAVHRHRHDIESTSHYVPASLHPHTEKLSLSDLKAMKPFVPFSYFFSDLITIAFSSQESLRRSQVLGAARDNRDIDILLELCVDWFGAIRCLISCCSARKRRLENQDEYVLTRRQSLGRSHIRAAHKHAFEARKIP